MNAASAADSSPLLSFAAAAALFAVDPHGTGGACVRSLAHPLRDQWLALLRDSLPPSAPLRRIPCNITDDRLLGGLDLTATLRAHRPIAEHGVLAEANGGVIVIAMAERLSLHTASLLSTAQESGQVRIARDGVSLTLDSHVGIVALDEGMSDDERIPASLLDRMGFLLDFDGLGVHVRLRPAFTRAQIETARRLLPSVRASGEIIQALCATAVALGIGSLRAPYLALRAACASAALEGRSTVQEADVARAARLVLSPRALAMPTQPSDPADEPETEQRSEAPPPDESVSKDDAQLQISEQQLEDLVLAAAKAAIPAGLLERIRQQSGNVPQAGAGQGRVGAWRGSPDRGRPCGVRRGTPRGRARMNVIETLRAAAPWQRLRGRAPRDESRIRVVPADFRITRFKQRTQTLTIFAVDASGSAAINRLAEAKGAVELLLADCYIRRDQVAVISFRGRSAELLLPPTRSLVRAKRSLAQLPGGGGTPLACGLESAWLLGHQSQRRGETPTLVVLTDGRANVGRNGEPGRESAHRQALDAARAVARSGMAALFVDTSPRPNALARDLAVAMRAVYIPLPHADARALSAIVGGSVTR